MKHVCEKGFEDMKPPKGEKRKMAKNRKKQKKTVSPEIQESTSPKTKDVVNIDEVNLRTVGPVTRVRYPGPGNRCLPPYLQRGQFERMRDGAGLIIPVHANLKQFLESLPARQIDAVILLDSQDWMAPEEIRALWNMIDRAGSDDVPNYLPHRGQGIAAGKPRTRLVASYLAPQRRTQRARL